MGNRKYKIGDKFNCLKIEEIIRYPYKGIQKNRKTFVKLKCKCDCGNISEFFPANVFSGQSKNCHRCQNVKEKDLKIGCLSLIEKKRFSENEPFKYKCQCLCGAVFWREWKQLYNRKWLKCTFCPKKIFKKYKNRQESIKAINYQKHLKSREKLIGRVNGRLKILSFSHWEYKRDRRFAIYNAKCKCGKNVKIRGDYIYIIKSCGCIQKQSIPSGEKNPLSKLKNDEVKAIRDLYASNAGFRLIDLANMFGVSPEYISKLINFKTYKNI